MCFYGPREKDIYDLILYLQKRNKRNNKICELKITKNELSYTGRKICGTNHLFDFSSLITMGLLKPKCIRKANEYKTI